MELEIISPKYGKFIVYYDDEDYDLVRRYKWSISKSKKQYVVRTHVTENGKPRTAVMSNVICGKSNGVILYADKNSLNNRRSNFFILNPNQHIEHDSFWELIISHRKYGKRSVFFDKEDYAVVSNMSWSLKHQRNRFYANSQWVSMHRFLMGFPEGKEIDHIDNNGLNNRRVNLRVSTHAQNGMNRGNQSNNSTGYKGVYLYSNKGRVKKFWAFIWVNGKRISGGYFEKASEAAKKYNELAIKHHGEFAFLNIITHD